jgi:hypothetical protein
MHLRPDELIDVVEGARTEQSVPHLAACEGCRRQLAELKAMMSAAAEVEVPEPSPLFWDHFSARVREAVAADGAPRRSFWTWPRLAVPAVAVALAGLLFAVALDTGPAMPPPPSTVAVTAPAPSIELFADPQSPGDDMALNLVAELSSGMDLDAAREAGLAVGDGAEHAVTHLDGSELRELRRLLQEELARSGA